MATNLERIQPRDSWVVDEAGEIIGMQRSGSPSAAYLPATRVPSVLAKSVSEIQDAHDELVRLGGGQLHFVPQAEYVWKDTDPSVNIESMFVDLYFHRSKHNLSACADGFEAFKFASTVTGVGDNYALRAIYDPWFFTNRDGGASTTGPTAFRFDSPTVGSYNRIQIYRPRIKGMLRGLSYGSRSYFVRVYNAHISRCRHAIYQTASPVDFAEMNTFEGSVFDDNYSHLTDIGGQQWRFKNCSFDYHAGYLFDLSAGSRMLGDDIHAEWDYGANVSETNSPIRMQGSNVGVSIIGNSTFVYVGSGQNPYYPAIASMDNTSQRLVVNLVKAVKLGRLSNTTDFDAFALTTNSTSPLVSLRINPDGVSVNDLPSMSLVSEASGVIGQLRNGADNPLNELSHRIAVTGTAAVSGVSVDENGVTRKAGKNMLKITGQGKVIISFPQTEGNRRHAWSFFTNPVFVTGSATIKERQTGFSPKFDGTTVTFVADTRGAVYSATTVTVAAGANAWTRRSWKDCSSTVAPAHRQNVAGVIMIEIDTALMTAGALYLSHVGFDLI